MSILRWILVRPTRDAYQYPDHYDLEAYTHALQVAHAPIQWRWPIAMAIRLWRRS